MELTPAERIIDRFNLQYNNALSNMAPGLETYEINMYLNMAHIEIINEYGSSVDLFEKYRSVLTAYIIEDKIPEEITDDIPETLKDRGLDYQLFELSENYWRIIKELAITKSNTTGITIKPISYDGFNMMSENPHKRPNGKRA